MKNTHSGTAGPATDSRTRIKICGLTRAQDVDAAVHAGADAIGFVLYQPSPRSVTMEQAAGLAQHLPPLVRPVLLFVNAEPDFVQAAASAVPGAILQFHGNESNADCARMAGRAHAPYWRVAHIPAGEQAMPDLLQFARTSTGASALLLDTQSPGYGGSGKSFDWSRLPPHIPAHLVLSGGLHSHNVAAAIAVLRARGRSLTVDVSSGVEARTASGQPRKGIKDAGRMVGFVAAVRAADLMAAQSEHA